MQKVADAADMSVLFFQLVLIFGPFWAISAILGHFLGQFGQFWVIFGLFWVILGHFTNCKTCKWQCLCGRGCRRGWGCRGALRGSRKSQVGAGTICEDDGGVDDVDNAGDDSDDGDDNTGDDDDDDDHLWPTHSGGE